MILFAAVTWHWWIAPLLTAGAVLGTIGVIVGYLRKVTAMRYPPKPKRDE